MDFKCLCGKTFNKKEFKKHFRDCNNFKEKYKNFDLKLSQLLYKYCKININLIMIKFLLERFVKLIAHKINFLNAKSSIPLPHNFDYKKKYNSNNNRNYNNNCNNNYYLNKFKIPHNFSKDMKTVNINIKINNTSNIPNVNTFFNPSCEVHKKRNISERKTKEIPNKNKKFYNLEKSRVIIFEIRKKENNENRKKSPIKIMSILNEDIYIKKE